MSESRYAIGLDFGTLTARGVLVDIANGKEVAVSICGYQDAVIDQMLPEDNHPLPADFALQNPQDYEYALESILKDVWRKGGIRAEQVVGIGVDFTACAMLPLDRNLKPLCYNPRFRKNPHSWVKIWKHKAARRDAHTFNRVAQERNESFLRNYGNFADAQMFFPKILETLNQAPNVYRATYRFVEAGDWVVYLLTGVLRKSIAMASYKAFWEKGVGYPSEDYFAAVHKELRDVISKKVGLDAPLEMGAAGHLSKRMATITGLTEQTMVAVCGIDAHCSFLGGGITTGSTLMMSIGTCICHMLASPLYVQNTMTLGVVRDGILPGYYGYETAQPAVGDMFDWYIGIAASCENLAEAQKHNKDVYSILNERIARIRPGASGLMAMDWWNGNSSFLRKEDLSGALLGMTLSTTADEIYRALIEATAFGIRKMIDGFAESCIPVEKVCACGAIAFNSPQIMQIYADVIGKPIYIARSKQTAALGAAMNAAVAAGKQNGGYSTIYEAIQNMSMPPVVRYWPDTRHADVYEHLYEVYNQLHDAFGNSRENPMEKLHHIRHMARVEQLKQNRKEHSHVHDI